MTLLVNSSRNCLLAGLIILCLRCFTPLAHGKAGEGDKNYKKFLLRSFEGPTSVELWRKWPRYWERGTTVKDIQVSNEYATCGTYSLRAEISSEMEYWVISTRAKFSLSDGYKFLCFDMKNTSADSLRIVLWINKPYLDDDAQKKQELQFIGGWEGFWKGISEFLIIEVYPGENFFRIPLSAFSSSSTGRDDQRRIQWRALLSKEPIEPEHGYDLDKVKYLGWGRPQLLGPFAGTLDELPEQKEDVVLYIDNVHLERDPEYQTPPARVEPISKKRSITQQRVALGKYYFENGKIKGIDTTQKLDKAAVFNFAIMSDNKGDGPSDERFARMLRWIKGSNAQFVIGLGDHLCSGYENEFLPFLQENEWWQKHFYPNVADGENGFYVHNQGKWAGGAPMLEEVKLSKRPNVVMRQNGAEYYARIEVDDYTLHLIQLHFPDNPKDPNLGFPEDSRRYAIETIQSIKKGPKDIIIVAAHTKGGCWIDAISEKRKKIVMENCDLLLSATTHKFKRHVIPGYENKGALSINTGSITYANLDGYVHVHVLEEPLSLVVQYIPAKEQERKLQPFPMSLIKIVGGEILEGDFSQ